ncbi:MAG: hypothetical protein A2252_07400 [Elusimicrobia bacterium RIFOXYA2_FULL_39_19]|nr:MAG: hypothetical protein A2252_07400 [Elusimicrobia bacterium RIFOXYA2_FULL_39_19]
MKKNELSEYYTNYHISKNKLGTTFADEKKGEIIKNWIGQNKKVLDLGCRDGYLTKHYSAGNDLTGVDIDKSALQICANNLKINTLWLNLNEENIPFDDNTFDVVVASEIIEHLFSPEKTLEKVMKVLKRNGLFIGSVPNSFRLKNRIKFMLGKEFEDDITHLHHFSIKELKILLNRYFYYIEIIPFASKYLFLAPKLFANDLIWKCKKK